MADSICSTAAAISSGKSASNILPGKCDTLSLGAALSGGSGTVTWKSSKSSVATVSSKGKITAKKAGSTIITAKCGTSYKKVKIVVS